MVLGLLAHVMPSIFFSRFLRSEALVYNSYFFFRTAILQKLCDVRFSYKHCNFWRVCLLFKMASKTVTRSISVISRYIYYFHQLSVEQRTWLREPLSSSLKSRMTLLNTIWTASSCLNWKVIVHLNWSTDKT